MKIEDLEKALQYFVIAVPESEEQAKAYFWARKALTALRSMLEAGEPLTVERLREMDGKPVWIEDVNRWRFVSIPEAGQFKNTPSVLFRKEDVQFEWQIEDSELTVYSYPPAHIDRSEWISVKERLPEAYYGESDNVLVVDEIGIRKILYFDGGCWCYPTGETYDRKVTHWMPLPEPPEEG